MSANIEHTNHPSFRAGPTRRDLMYLAAECGVSVKVWGHLLGPYTLVWGPRDETPELDYAAAANEIRIRRA